MGVNFGQQCFLETKIFPKTYLTSWKNLETLHRDYVTQVASFYQKPTTLCTLHTAQYTHPLLGEGPATGHTDHGFLPIDIRMNTAQFILHTSCCTI